MNYFLPMLAFAAAYLLGSINSAVMISRAFFGDDVRNHGSGNAGTTNMMRTYGAKAAAFCFAGDILKGMVSVWIAKAVFIHCGLPQYSASAALIAGIIAVLGHMYPIYFRFKGGKGVATGLGAVSAINTSVFGVIFIIGIAIAGFSGYVSLASLTGAVLFIPALCVYHGYFGNVIPLNELIPAAVLVLLIIYNHRTNIKRLMTGTENKFYKKK